MTQAHEGDPWLEALLEQEDWMRGFAKSLVADPNLAEDIMQETMLAALTASERRSERAWYRRVMRNIAYRHQNSERTREDYESRVANRESTQPRSGLARDASYSVRQALAALDEPYRSVLFAKYVTEQTSVQIAREAGIPEGTVRWRIMRGLAILRERLDTEFEGGRTDWAQALVLAYPAIRGGDALEGGPGGSPESADHALGGFERTGAPKVAAFGPIGLAAVVAVALVGLLATAWILLPRGDREFDRIAGSTELAALPTEDLDAVGSSEQGDVGSVAAADARIELEEAIPNSVDTEVASTSEPEDVIEPAAPATNSTCKIKVFDLKTKVPVRGASVLVVSPTGKRVAAATDAEGLVSVPFRSEDFDRGNVAMMPDAISIQIRAKGFMTSYAHSLTRDMLSKAGNMTLNIPMDPRAGRIYGRVTDPAGNGLVGASVTVESTAVSHRFAPQPGFLVHERFETTLTTVDGLYELTDVVTEPVTVRILCDGFLPYVGQAKVGDGLDQEINVTLEAAGLLRGKILDPDGNAVAGARVWADPRDSATVHSSFGQPGFEPRLLGFRSATVSDANGSFTLTGFDKGVTRVWVQDERQPDRMASMEFDRGNGSDQQWTAQLTSRSPLQIQAVDESGAPVTNLALHVHTSKRRKPQWERYVELDGKGRATIHDWIQAPIDISIVPLGMGDAPLSHLRAVQPSTEDTVEIVLRPLARADFKGRVVMHNGDPAPAGLVVCTSLSDEMSYRASIHGNDGTFVTKMPLGRHTVVVQFPGLGCAELDPVEFLESQVVDLDIKLQAPVPLEPFTDGRPRAEGGRYSMLTHTDFGSKSDIRSPVVNGAGVPSETLEVLPGVYSIAFFREDKTYWITTAVALPGLKGRFCVDDGGGHVVLLKLEAGEEPLPEDWTIRSTSTDGTSIDLNPEPAGDDPHHWFLNLAAGSHDLSILAGGEPVGGARCEVMEHGYPEVLTIQLP